MLSQYRIDWKLGAGGMGVVLRAEDLSLQRPVALKFLSGRNFDNDQLRARFLREARVIAGLNHRNICTIHAVGEIQPGEELTLDSGETLAAGTPFLALELIQGRTLTEILGKSPRLTIDEVLRLAIPVAEGLAAAHAKGLVHRDLKPDNVMVTADGQVKILDFGLAKPVSTSRLHDPDDVMTRAAEQSAELTIQGMILGTISYMSPEQAQGQDVDSRSDVFSFGVMLHELLSGQRPFDGGTAAATMAKIIESAPTPLTDARSDVSSEMVRIVDRCLRKPPDERYHDVRDLVVALKEERRENASGPVTAAVPAAPPRDRRALYAIGGVLLLGAIALGAWAFGGRGETPASGDPQTPPPGPPPGPVAPPPVMKLTQMTFDGKVLYPTISPDGGSIAYMNLESLGRARGARLMVLDIASGVALEVAGAKSLGAPSWSKDGSRLAYQELGEDDEWRGAMVSRLGGPVRHFLDQICWHPQWSPDGSRLAVAVRQPGAKQQLLVVDTRSLASVELNSDFLAKDWIVHHIDWSPNGELLAVTVQPERGKPWSLWVVEVATGASKQLFEVKAKLHRGQWSAEGDALYLEYGTPDVPFAVWRVEFDATTTTLVGEPRVVLPNHRGVPGMDISGDGRRAVYAVMSAHSNVWVTAPEPAATGDRLSLRQLTHGTRVLGAPALSPDGRHLVYAAEVPRAGVALYRSAVEGEETRQLTFPAGGAQHGSAVWSLDGDRIYFVEYIEGVTSVLSVPLAGGKTTRHGEVDWRRENVAFPDILADGRLVAQSHKSPQYITMFDPATGTSERLLDGDESEHVMRPSGSPDGRLIVFRRSCDPPVADRAGVWVFDLDSGAERRVAGDGYSPVGFTADGGDLILWSSDTPPTITVSSVPVAGGDVQKLGDLPTFTEVTAVMDMSADRSTIVLNVFAGSIDVWLAEDWDPTRPTER